MLKKLFGKKPKILEVKLVSPVEGTILKLEDVPDPVFSQKMMGDGIAFFPIEGKVVAPADAIVINVFPTKHAIALETAEGLEILIHIGLDTVNMKGEGFSVFVAEGDQVKAGDLLISYSLELVKEKASSIVTPMIITNGNILKELQHHYGGQSVAGKTTVLTAVFE
ncbi:PTS glucose transporter subunit IIA [Domibacillus sp. A3M-37]|nr:PTS glucose transporter subunit IIA [Domibacillus sp. A3M-37]